MLILNYMKCSVKLLRKQKKRDRHIVSENVCNHAIFFSPTQIIK